MTTEVQQLSAKLDAALRPGASPAVPAWLFRPLLDLLAKGEPVTADDLAAATGRSVEEVHHTLAAMPDTEFDDDGRVIGWGITLRATSHRFEIDGRQLYAWCALDTLMFPFLLDRPARVESPCYKTGAPVRVTVEPDGVTSVDPATAVMSIVTPDNPASVRGAFCNQVHFFTSAEAAQPWLDEHAGASVLPVEEAFRLGRRLADTMQQDAGRADGCSC